ncbi:hypothetical protein M409DRAFT_22060 [Zasmidium cellare ATCC 36951]|uniref:Uncharacterized protein n=1 Tax=Zasmidium cellare ATCC 36951 TaxID=1080233 RepID=A0A6A6CL32_ZASCE|nr:uncharacterized protein M409DRAFT_22060 [Zasmidium cellare ATCC 36951]KAF2167914.1 hypothetical protein M409DRAFT_22060 [Zasmidium cellare ATCC 36951]
MSTIWEKSFWVNLMDSMKNAWQGQGGGLQDASSTVGNVITEQTQSSGQKKADAANKSLTEMAGGNKRTGPTVGGTGVDAVSQTTNQQTGSADHLGIAMKK